MKIGEATRLYEEWVATRATLVPVDLRLKHQQMAAGVFPFLRATFYRWVQLWQEICPKLAAAPAVLAVGDLHVENFGSWRDAEGRLIWGVNDFDEAYPMAYTNDLVRLAASARVAAKEEHLAIRARQASEAILEGYREGLRSGGRAFVLAEHHKGLRDMALNELRDPVVFWKKMEALPEWKGPVPEEARRGLEELLPQPGLKYRRKRRVAGLGSLGRQRIVALADWGGGCVVREAKELVPSGCVWASPQKLPQKVRCEELITCAVRVRDPFVHVRGNWIVRRLAPDCSRIELSTLPKSRDEALLLHSMGWETANVHLGSREAVRAIVRDLARRPGRWLHQAAKKMTKALTREWKEWKNA